MASAAAKTVTQLCVIRFFLGLAEASTYAGTIYIIGAWYKPEEISKRTALFTASGQVGTMFAGVMMTAIHKSMRGMSGLQGWQWVFLIGKSSRRRWKYWTNSYRRYHHPSYCPIRLPLLP
jgi:MFS transporter, ACS family, pantothenate transporter